MIEAVADIPLLQASLLEALTGVQETLPDLGPAPGVLPPTEPPAPGPGVPLVISGQLSFGPAQQELSPQQAPARQLALLPDPPLWEMDPGPPPAPVRAGRLDRKRRRRGISPGQQSLF
ncbi:MAG: hypothetical protein ACRDIU_07765 [Actinomycetota bacterium]